MASNEESLALNHDIQLVVFGNSTTENRVVCTTLPPTGLTGTEYSAWCDQKSVGKGAELIYPTGVANTGTWLKIRVLELQILGYWWS